MRRSPNSNGPDAGFADRAAAVFAQVAAAGGTEGVFLRIAREASEAGAGVAAVVRLERAASVPVAVWPPTDTADWLTGFVMDAQRLAAIGRAHAVGAYLVAPIVVDGACWGAIVARDASTCDPRIFEHLAGLAALFVGRAPAAGRTVSTAGIDPLTGVAGHRAFRERLAEEYRTAQAHGADLSLVLIDIDRFKHVNDTHGHLVGDGVLAEFAARLAGCARSTDFIGRTGGEEFGWIMPGVDAKSAWEAAERFRAQVSGVMMGPVERVTASVGICTATQARDLEELVRFAEGALYWAKDRGRDAAYVFTPDVVRVLSEEERTQQMSRAHAMRSIRTLARAVDAKDHSTREHSERVADLAVQISIALGWSMERTARLRDAGLLHDVGKIGIPDAVLLKPAALTDAEYEQVKSHPVLGARIAADVLDEEQQAWVRGHHERIDGRGYPDGLAGEDIPDGARILALADSWDVMTSVRSYSEAWSLEEALLDCRAESGRQFWPQAVAALEALYEAGALLVQTRTPAPTTKGRPARTTEVA